MSSRSSIQQNSLRCKDALASSPNHTIKNGKFKKIKNKEYKNCSGSVNKSFLLKKLVNLFMILFDCGVFTNHKRWINEYPQIWLKYDVLIPKSTFICGKLSLDQWLPFEFAKGAKCTRARDLGAVPHYEPFHVNWTLQIASSTLLKSK